MNEQLDLNIFMTDLASGAPTPGGGSAAAVAGALAAALAAMIGRLTAGRKRYAAVNDQMESLIAEADRLQAQLTSLASQDAAAYETVRSAFRLPRESDEQKTARQTAIQEALKGASRTPLATASACLDVLRLLQQAARSGNPNAATDAQVGALLAQAALQGAALNVRINLADIRDADFTAACETALSQIETQAAHLAVSN